MTTHVETRWSEGARSGLLHWILPASVLFHIVVFAWLPSARRAAAAPLPPIVIEVADLPPPPPPPPEPPAPAATEEPAPAKIATPVTAAPLARRDTSPASSTTAASAPTEGAPLDFTSTVFSNDGAGIAINGGPRGTGAASAAAKTSPPPAAPAEPRFVAAASLARRPRAPGLDTELERQYPAEARRSGISGGAVLRVRVLPDGRIGAVRTVSETWAGFGRACERTVRAGHWEAPIDQAGTPVATEITYTCRFEVRT